MRDFGWYDELWCVVSDDGVFAGVPCLSYEEARDLAAQHKGSQIFKLIHEDDVEGAKLPEENEDLEMGFDPYLGCYTDEV